VDDDEDEDDGNDEIDGDKVVEVEVTAALPDPVTVTVTAPAPATAPVVEVATLAEVVRGVAGVEVEEEEVELIGNSRDWKAGAAAGAGQAPWTGETILERKKRREREEKQKLSDEIEEGRGAGD
jgi:hypothetical protein